MRSHVSSLMRGRVSRNWKKHLILEMLEHRRVMAVSAFDYSPFDFSQIDVDTAEPNQSRILVRFRDEFADNISSIDLPEGSAIVDTYDILPELHEVEVSDGSEVQDILKEFRSRPDVLYAEPDYRVQIARTPDDPGFNNLWAMDNVGQSGGTFDADIDAVEAWEATTGFGSVIVAVIDTGVDYTHPDLAPNMWTNPGEIPGNNRDDDLNGFIDDIHGYDFVNRDGDPKDDFFHGTHVAGTIGAVGDNGIGVAGVAWNVQIMSLKFLDSSGGGYISDAISALNYAVANGAQISNNSWGGGGYSQALFDAIRAAGNANHIYVAAAGNESSNNDQTPAYPASYDLPNIISVAATDRNDRLAFFSNVGTRTVDVGAPGVDIYSTFPTYLTPAMQGSQFRQNYETISGTSMAAPHVSGLAALIVEQHPDWSSSRVIEQIFGTVDPLTALRQTATGGRINAALAVGVPVPDVRGPRVTTSSPTGVITTGTSSISFTFSEPILAWSFDLDDIRSFTGPDGSLLDPENVFISGGGRAFTIWFPEQTTKGNYELVIGPDIWDESSNAMDQNSDGRKGDDPGDRYQVRFTISDNLIFTSTDVPVPIRDWRVSTSQIRVDQDVLIGDLDIQLDITHTYDSDLAIYIASPNNPSSFMPLSQFRGGAGRNFRGTIFDDEAATPIANGSAPFSGSYRPERLLSQFDGQNARGIWQLRIEDLGWLDEGQLNSWSMTVQPGSGVINPVNQPPEAQEDYIQTNEDTPVTINVLANDRDPDADPLTVATVSDVYGGQAVINADNTVTFTPELNLNYYYGGAGFSYSISDGRGGTAYSYVWIDILPVNDAPIAEDDLVETTKNQTIVFSPYYGYSSPAPLEQNDRDVDGDWLWVQSVGNARNGSVRMEPTGEVIFVAAQDFLGTASFEYTVSDGTLTDTGLVQIEIRDIYYFSTGSSGSLVDSIGGTVQFTSSDILQMSVNADGSYQYSMYFDGSDVGLTTANENIDAFTLMPDGGILLSTVGSFSVTTYGYNVTGSGEDLLYFWPDSTGDSTSGYWSLYFDGSNVGLSGADESIDAVSVLSDGRILISTAGPVRVPGVTSGADEDLLAFTPYSYGPGYTSGTWAMYFDGSDVGLGESDDEDVDGLYVRENPVGGLPSLFVSTRGPFDVGSLNGDKSDIFEFTPTRLGGTTVGSYSAPAALQGSQYGLSGFNIDGFYLGRPAYGYPQYPASSLSRAEGESNTSPDSRPLATDSAILMLAPSLLDMLADISVTRSASFDLLPVEEILQANEMDDRTTSEPVPISNLTSDLTEVQESGSSVSSTSQHEKCFEDIETLLAQL